MENAGNTMPLISKKTAMFAALGVGLFALAKAVYNEMTKYELRGKVVLITGGSRGLGLAMARELAAKGARIVICARNEDQLEDAKEDLLRRGADVLALEADVTIQDDVNRVIQRILNRFGQLDVVINNAGMMMVGAEDVMDVEEYKKVMDSNLWSALYTIKAALPQFLQQGEGRIVNICSIGGKIAVPHMLPYSVSKFAMVGLSEGLGAELKKDNIHVTTVIPNLMRTGSPRNVSVKGDHGAEYEWFKLADSLPILSQNADDAAKEIIQALENGANEVILTQTAKVVVALQGVIPGGMTSIMQLANRFLPKSGNDHEVKRGFESETKLSKSWLASLTDDAAVKFNEV
ncbi:SDR family NAD(P)-dependent oxidoreductase [Dyadobacter sp. CY345]|uniref:SDR family NAD(P)-dependent oxidoreductase n=1 Tax=Dyadobacter sp. CY345 TaxID=2909335 RepID=UPI001F310EC5|nr:SDR family NAD(P)-dependent oxidoreductase [Dyadobacter sp. CY345]MCF2443541.1 SDR family NAD(P)-dependent oxidoreductase [Dyadobacter sp. CY345]